MKRKTKKKPLVQDRRADLEVKRRLLKRLAKKRKREIESDEVVPEAVYKEARRGNETN